MVGLPGAIQKRAGSITHVILMLLAREFVENGCVFTKLRSFNDDDSDLLRTSARSLKIGAIEPQNAQAACRSVNDENAKKNIEKSRK